MNNLQAILHVQVDHLKRCAGKRFSFSFLGVQTLSGNEKDGNCNSEHKDFGDSANANSNITSPKNLAIVNHKILQLCLFTIIGGIIIIVVFNFFNIYEPLMFLTIAIYFIILYLRFLSVMKKYKYWKK